MLNKNLINKEVTADIGLNKDWVNYSQGNNGEQDHYRDVWVDGILAYCYGETCIVEGINRSNATVTLTNNQKQVFEIPYEQFKDDFKISI